MEFLTKKSLIKKIAILMIIIFLLSFCIPVKIVKAESFLESAGGVLLDAVMNFLVFVGDSVLNILQHNFLTLQDVTVQTTAESLGTFSWGFLFLGLAAVLVACTGVGLILEGGLAAIGIGTLIAVAGGTAVAIHSFGQFDDLIAGEFDIAMISYSPYTIFSGQIPALDINFINPMQTITDEKVETGTFIYPNEFLIEKGFDNEVDCKINSYMVAGGAAEIPIFICTCESNFERYYYIHSKNYGYEGTYELEVFDDFKIEPLMRSVCFDSLGIEINPNEILVNMDLGIPPVTAVEIGAHGGIGELTSWTGTINSENDYIVKLYADDDYNVTYKASYNNGKDEELITYTESGGYGERTLESSDIHHILANDILKRTMTEEIKAAGKTPEEVEAEVDRLIDEFKDDLNSKVRNGKKQAQVYNSSAAILQDSIATWYKVLRRVALVGLLSVLVYVGIRIVLSAAAADKAKYKKMFIDWLVAVCMLFVLHYLMIFILTLSTNLTSIFVKSGITNLEFTLPSDTEIDGQNLVDKIKENGEAAGIGAIKNVNGEECATWCGEFVGYIRMCAGASGTTKSTIYGFMYVVLVIYTCTFTFMYLRRALYMAFLTMIAPLIALTYPLDRIKDGQAQAFSIWLKEYIFNALIQPVHLIIYTMTVSTVIDLAVDHPVYGLVALGFIIPAEKFIKQMFGFEKASTISPLGSAFGGAAVMGLINKISKVGKGKKDKGEDKDDKGKIRTADKNKNLPEFDFGDSSDTQTSPDVRFSTGLQGNETNNPGDSRARNQQEADTDSARTTETAQQRTQTVQPRSQEDQSSNQTASNANNRANSNSRANQVSSQKKLTKGQKIKNGLYSVGNKGKNRILKSKPLKKTGKFIGMGIVGATVGTVAAAAGVTTGDFSKTVQFTAAGAGIGGAIGGRAGEKVMDEASYAKESFKEGYLGSEEYNNRKLDNEYFNGNGFQEMLDNNNLYSDLSGAKRAKKLRNEIENYRSAGITNNEQISSAIQNGLTTDEGIQAIRIAEYLKGQNLNDASKAKYKSDFEKKLAGNANTDKLWSFIESNL